jgi:hypothetical protein
MSLGGVFVIIVRRRLNLGGTFTFEEVHELNLYDLH